MNNIIIIILIHIAEFIFTFIVSALVFYTLESIKNKKRNKTDQEKFKDLFNDVGITYEEDGNNLIIDSFEVDGACEMIVKFWDGDDYPEGEYHEFTSIPDPYYEIDTLLNIKNRIIDKLNSDEVSNNPHSNIIKNEAHIFISVITDRIDKLNNEF